MNYEAIIAVVKQAGQFVFDKTLQEDIQTKGAADFVTAVDLKISSYVKEQLKQLTPEIGFMSEEEDGRICEKRWILDPIDGTTNLVYQYCLSSVSLAYFNGTEVEFGVIYNPYSQDLFVAKRGEGAYLNGEKLSKAPDRELSDCIIEFGAGVTHKQDTEPNFAIAKEVFQNCLDLRRMCSSALAIAYVAAGRISGYFECDIKPWDYAAATLMVEECGGICTDWDGNALQYEKPSSYLCATPKAYKFLEKTIQKHKDQFTQW